MHKYLKLAPLLIGLVALIWIIACAINPVTGKREFMLLSESDEVALGQQSDQEVIDQYGIYPDAKLSAYVTEVGQKMAQISHRPQLSYQFKVLDSPVVNAFAVPGGYVYVTRGILSYLNDEAELAGVVGHELGHVNARHTAKQYSQMQLAQIGLGLGVMLSEDFRKYAGLAQFGVNLLFLKFSRDDERQADDLGVEYSSKVGYDSYRMAAFFETLERLSGGSANSGLPDWFSTHPNPVDRIGAVRKKTAQWQTKLAGASFAVNRDPYLHSVDGILQGEDPRQGYVENAIFYQPTMKFTFPVPKDWTLNNTPKQVQILSPKEDAVIMFAMQPNATPQAVAQKFRQDANAMVQSADALSINGLSAYRMLAAVPQEQDTVAVLSYFIQKEGNVYFFHNVCAPASLPGYQSTFAATSSQFRPLTDAGHINVQPSHLRVRSVTAGGTLSSVLGSWGYTATQLTDLAVMNGLQEADPVTAGTLLKVVAK